MSMKAVLLDGFGRSLRIGEAPVPEPGPGQLLIRVAYAGINPADYKERVGQLPHLASVPRPYVPGNDAAGIVERAGPGCTRFAPGDRVTTTGDHLFGDGGSFADYVRVEEDHVGPIPDGLGFAEAATIGVAGRTAWQALFAPEKGALLSGQTVLIHGAAGGVGSYAVQFAKARGLTVIATCRTDNLDYVVGLGADRAIDYRHEDIGESVRAWLPGGVDAIVDAVSGGTLPAPLDLLAPGGRLVQIATGTVDGDVAAMQRDATARGFRHVFAICSFDGAPEELAEIGGLIAQGKVRVPPIRIFPIEEIDAALDLVGGQHVRGKLVLKIADL